MLFFQDILFLLKQQCFSPYTVSISKKNHLEKVLPQVALEQLGILADALDKYEHAVTHHDMFCGGSGLFSWYKQVIQVPEHLLRVNNRLVFDWLWHELFGLVKKHGQPVVVDVPAVFYDVLVFMGQCETVHEILQGPIDLLGRLELNDVAMMVVCVQINGGVCRI